MGSLFVLLYVCAGEHRGVRVPANNLFSLYSLAVPSALFAPRCIANWHCAVRGYSSKYRLLSRRSRASDVVLVRGIDKQIRISAGIHAFMNRRCAAYAKLSWSSCMMSDVYRDYQQVFRCLACFFRVRLRSVHNSVPYLRGHRCAVAAAPVKISG